MALGRYPSFVAASSTRTRVSGETLAPGVNVLLTTETLTPTEDATSCSVTLACVWARSEWVRGEWVGLGTGNQIREVSIVLQLSPGIQTADRFVVPGLRQSRCAHRCRFIPGQFGLIAITSQTQIGLFTVPGKVLHVTQP